MKSKIQEIIQNIHPGFLLLVISLLNLCYLVPTSDLNQFYLFQLTQILQLAFVILFFSQKRLPNWIWIVLCYFISRGLLMGSNPLFEDDYYRYLWDAQVLSAGINPYLYTPDNAALDFLDPSWRLQVNFINIKTIYPPVAQLYFYLVYKIFGLSLLGLRIGGMILEVLAAGFIFKIAGLLNQEVDQEDRRHVDSPLIPSLVFLFFPTVMKENINSVHFDILSVTLTLASIYFLSLQLAHKKIKYFGWSFLAMSVQVKIYSLLLVPIFMMKERNRILSLTVFAGTLIAFSFPFLNSGFESFEGLQTFSLEWTFYESLFRPLQWLFGEKARWMAGGFVVAAVIAISFFYKIRSTSDLIRLLICALCFLLALSPVVNTWYCLWIIPMMILLQTYWAFALPLIISLGYSWIFDPLLYQKLHRPFYGLFFLILIAQELRKISLSQKSPLIKTLGSDNH